MAIGSENVPDSSIHETPVISPLPFWEKKPAVTGSAAPAGPRGRMAVTPVRTESPRMMVAYPTCTPGTSVMAFQLPGVPPNGMPRDLARGLPKGVAACGPVRFSGSTMGWLPGCRRPRPSWLSAVRGFRAECGSSIAPARCPGCVGGQ